ncbi:hypothetical protein E3T26_11245 [Cryobacterium sp. TMT1-21]|uniref:DNA helicase n=1 Tax=Cryobacterium shii TaxID=1259235 RepID=A0AAQ2HFQ4_9MICO|nr:MULTISPECIES: hypothetical protein [Cryobacterium]TFC48947.1 hypothetical protein E3O49_06980 [Cryobacterium shii]TFC82934.1 hypothetical protein E3T24_12460 [Cryobacterium sp. TmT2-59]TFD12596.1 hypothetical protein E3T26_11245 [Cryobacterium sp. TMT1-21]TFD17220.1 hypothetical protein E3T42_07955 [Cryobacterium sp. TMT4-10]TFD25760.1 hypothetical protein E3T32_03825 [Cryobacterium sp. TMT2-23]
MSLSRKRRKELTRLRKSADELWNNQQEVLERVNALAREASRQAGVLTREEVVPKVRESYDQIVRPKVQATQELAEGVRHQVVDKVLPGIGTAVGTLMSVGDVAHDARIRAALNRVRFQKPIVVQKKGPGAGTYIGLGVALAAAVGVAYAVWQTFRADDELWVAEDEPAAATSVED